MFRGYGRASGVGDGDDMQRCRDRAYQLARPNRRQSIHESAALLAVIRQNGLEWHTIGDVDYCPMGREKPPARDGSVASRRPCRLMVANRRQNGRRRPRAGAPRAMPPRHDLQT